MQVVYDGPDAVREIEAQTEDGQPFRARAEKGKPVEVPRDIGDRLIEQEDWSAAGGDQRPKKGQPTKNSDEAAVEAAGTGAAETGSTTKKEA